MAIKTRVNSSLRLVDRDVQSLFSRFDRGGFGGKPVEMNLVIAGTDPVAVDAVGAAVMEIPPSEVKHLVLAMEKGLGTCNLDEITVLGEPIDGVKRKFQRSLSSKLLVHIG